MKRISMMSLAAALVATQVYAGPLDAAKWIRANVVTRPETDLSGVKWIRPVPTVKKLFSTVPNRSMATFFKISEAPTNAVAELCFAAQGKFVVSLFREGGEVELYRNGGDFENARELHYMDIAPWLAAGDNAINVTREDDGEKDPRFLMKLSLGYTDRAETVEILKRFIGGAPLEEVSPVLSAEELVAMQEAVKQVYVHPDLAAYSAALCERTRTGDQILMGASTRGNLALIRAAQALAAIRGRDYILPDDLKELANPVLGHRIILRGTLKSRQNQVQSLLEAIVGEVPVPTESWTKA